MLATKLSFPPLRTQLVPRTRLVEQLQEGLKRPLILISAPAGYGKTTLLLEWRIGVGRKFPVAWLALDEDDNDLHSFLNYIALALETAGTGLAGNTLLLLQSPAPTSTERILTSLVDDLSGYPHDLAIILDDYHAIDSKPIHEALRFLLEHLPAHIHLVLLTRSDPPLPLPRLRVRNQVMEIRTADLRFTFEETAAFLKDIMSLELAAQDIAALEARTEGWIAGLQLAALSMQGRSDIPSFIAAFTGSHHYVVDYLVEEVLNRQNEAIRDFLLKTSILNRLSAPLCNALTGQSDGQQMLEHLERSNLFLTPMDDERHWYRYHHLFADVLRNRLQHSQPELLAALYRRAIAWYEENGFIDQAISHALAVSEFEYAAQLLARHWLDLLTHGQMHTTLIQWLDALPRDLHANRPRLNMLHAWLLVSAGNMSAAQPYALRVAQAMEQDTSETSELASLPAELLAFESYKAIHERKLDYALELARQALQLAPEDAVFTRTAISLAQSWAYLEMGCMDEALQASQQGFVLARSGSTPASKVSAVNNMGLALQVQGQLHHAMDVYREALQDVEVEAQEHYPQYGLIYIGMADIHYQWNNLERAHHHFSVGHQMVEQGGYPVEVITARLGLAKLRYAQGEYPATLELLEDVAPLLQKAEGAVDVDKLEALQARWQAALGQTDPAATWLSKIDLTVGDSLGISQATILFSAARVLLALSRLDEALNILSKMERVVHNGDNLSWEIEALVLQSMVWHRNGDSTRAFSYLEKALTMGEKEGFIRIFLDEGQPMVDMLRKSNFRFAGRLLASASTKILQPVPAFAAQGLIEPLSERELEVLKLIAAGRLNKEIGNELYIAIGTVKRHTANIFRKLDVINRTQAVARSRELRLL